MMQPQGLNHKAHWLFVVLILFGMVLLAMPVHVIWAMPPPNGTVPPKPSGGDEGEPGEQPTPIPTSQYIEVNKKIDYAGGSIDLWLVDGHCVLIQIAPGAFNEEIQFQVDTVEPHLVPAAAYGGCDDPSVSETLNRATVAYTLKAWRAAGGEIPPTEQVAPYQHVICYTAADLALADNDPSNFVIASYDETDQQWVPHPTTLDAANTRVIASADHLSWWALMVRRPCAPAEEVIAQRLPETGQAPTLQMWQWTSIILGLVLVLGGTIGLYRQLSRI